MENTRNSLLGTPIVASPIRRSVAKSPWVPLEQSNDEDERSKRRSAVAMQKRISNIAPSTPSSLTEINNVIGQSNIKDHLAICTKLYSENKITIKNAWELHIIDVIRQIVHTETSDVLQVVGTSLDIGTRVYCFRVDDVHTRGLKLASSMTKMNPREGNQDEDDEVEDANSGGQEGGREKTRQKKKKKFIQGEKSTIVKDETTLFAALPQLESVVFSTKEDSELSSAENLMTFKFPINPRTLNFDLLSTDKYIKTEPELYLNNNNKFPDLLNMISVVKNDICHAFADFAIGEWDPEEEEKELGQNKTVQEEIALDENGLPIPELDGSIHDIFQEANDDRIDEPVSDPEDRHEEVLQAQIHGEIPRIVDAIPEEDVFRSDYGFNTLLKTASGKVIDKIWAGPSHWKIKYVRPSVTRYSGTSVQQVPQTKKRMKVIKKLDLETEVEIDMENVFAVKRTPPQTSSEKITLPLRNFMFTDIHKDVKSFMTRPGSKVVVPVEQPVGECDIQPYNYENPNDSQYCLQQHIEDDFGADNEPGNDSFGEEQAPAAQQNFVGEHLVNLPDLVPVSNVPYSVHAKKMDMKKLKAAIWKCLTRNDPRPEVDPREAEVTKTSFRRMYTELLLEHLTADMKKELSVPLAFIALLHLCNENNLKLIQDSNYKNFQIVKATSLQDCK